MKDSIRILFVEDVASDAEMIWRELKKNNFVFDKMLVETKKEYTAALKSYKPELIISDFSLPQFDGMTALILKNELAPEIPFILVTGSINEETAVEVMKAGADDYVIKHNLSRLGQSITGALRKREIVIEKEKAEMALRLKEAKLSSIFRVLPVGIGLVEDRRIIEVNPHICIMTGYTAKELIGASSAILYPSKKEYDYVGVEKYRQISEKGTGVVETIWKRKDGKIINIILASTPLNSDDHSHGITFTALDITDRKKTEDDLKQKIAELEHFNELTVGREQKMIELKKEVNYLLTKLGEKEKYIIWE